MAPLHRAVSFAFVFLLSISFIAAVGIDNPYIPIVKPDPTTFDNTTGSVNNSLYWDGNAWSDTRWLNIDGSNANTEINIGTEDFVTGGDINSSNMNIGSGSDITKIINNEVRVYNENAPVDAYIAIRGGKHGSANPSFYSSLYDMEFISAGLNKAIRFNINNAGVSERYEIDEGKWKSQTTGEFNFDNDNITTLGNITADYFFGNGSSLTDIPGDNLGNHIATQNIEMEEYNLSNFTEATGKHITLTLEGTVKEGIFLDGDTNPFIRDQTSSTVFKNYRTFNGAVGSSDVEHLGMENNIKTKRSLTGGYRDPTYTYALYNKLLIDDIANGSSGGDPLYYAGSVNILDDSNIDLMGYTGKSPEIIGSHQSVLNADILNIGSNSAGYVFGNKVDMRSTFSANTSATSTTSNIYGDWLSVRMGNSLSIASKNLYGIFFEELATYPTNNTYSIYNNDLSLGIKAKLFNDNQKNYYGTGEDVEVYWDGTNHITNTTTGIFQVKNNTGWGTIEYGTAITHTTVNNDSKALETFNDGNSLYNEDGSINHTAFGDCYIQIEQTDFSRPVNVSDGEKEYCIKGELEDECFTYEDWHIEYPYTILEDGVDVNCEQAKLRQSMALINHNMDLTDNLTIFHTSTLAEHYVTNTTKDPATLTKVENFYANLKTKTYQEMKDMILTPEGKLSDAVLFNYEKSDIGSYNIEGIAHTSRAIQTLMLWKLANIEDKQNQQLDCWDLSTQSLIVQCMRNI